MPAHAARHALQQLPFRPCRQHRHKCRATAAGAGRNGKALKEAASLITAPMNVRHLDCGGGAGHACSVMLAPAHHHPLQKPPLCNCPLPHSICQLACSAWAGTGPLTMQTQAYPKRMLLPTQVHVEEQLTPVERLSMAPFWSTFCGTSNGAWQGTQAAFSPVTGACSGGHALCMSAGMRPTAGMDGILGHGCMVMYWQC